MECSSSSHTWDAFQLAHASFRLYCVRNNLVLPDDNRTHNDKVGPHILGDPPKIDVPPPEVGGEDDEEEGSPGSLPAINIYDDDVNMRFLVCGVACTLVSLKKKNSLLKFVITLPSLFSLGSRLIDQYLCRTNAC